MADETMAMDCICKKYYLRNIKKKLLAACSSKNLFVEVRDELKVLSKKLYSPLKLCISSLPREQIISNLYELKLAKSVGVIFNSRPFLKY